MAVHAQAPTAGNSKSQRAISDKGADYVRGFLIGCGVAAPLVYLGTVVLGGIITPDYSHAAQAISELIAAGAPRKALLDALFILYNGLVIAFGIGMSVSLRGNGRRATLAGALTLTALGVFGVVMTLFFPMDLRGTPMTLTGTVHIVLAGAMSFLSILTILASGIGFRAIPKLASLRPYSLATVLVVLVTGGLAAAGAASESPHMGVYERLTIGAFLQWILVVALRVIAMDSRRLSALSAGDKRRSGGLSGD